MAIRKVIALDRQTPVDLAIQEHGAVDALFNVLSDEPAVTGITQPLVPGMPLSVKSDPVSPDVARFYAARKFKPVTGDILPLFFCAGPECFPAHFGEAGLLEVTTSTGYLCVRHGGIASVYGDGGPSIIYCEHAAGELCLYPCNESGEYGGQLTNLVCSAAASWWSFKWLFSVNALIFNLGVRRDVDLTSMASLTQVALSGVPGDRHLRLNPVNQIGYLQAIGLSIQNTDQVVNRMSALIPGGYLEIDTGAPRTSASDDKYTALISAGWTISTP